jgi:hypothetical protein
LNTLSLDWNYSQSKALLSFTNPFLNSSNAYMYLSNDVVLNKNKTLLLNIFAWYNFKGASDLDRNNAYSQLDASLKYLALNKKLQIGISGEDILSSNHPVYTGFTNHTQVEYKNYYDNRLLRISLLYKFGNKNIDVEKKDFGNESEKQRAN